MLTLEKPASQSQPQAAPASEVQIGCEFAEQAGHGVFVGSKFCERIYLMSWELRRDGWSTHADNVQANAQIKEAADGDVGLDRDDACCGALRSTIAPC